MNDVPNNALGSGPRADDAIEAVSFSPSNVDETTRRFTPIQIVLALALVVAAALFWFLFTSKSVQIRFDPPAETVSVSGGLSFELGGVWLLREGRYQISAQTALHQPVDRTIEVGDPRNQTFDIEFIPLPGRLVITPSPEDARIEINGIAAGTENELESGLHEVRVSHPRYLPKTVDVDIVGRRETQQIAVALDPNWADVEVSTTPAGAEVLIDGTPWPATTPTVIEALAGERLIEFRLDGHKTHRQRIFAQASDAWAMESVTLTRADATVDVSSSPSGAGVIVNGSFVGQTPIDLDLKSGATHRVQVVQNGYERFSRAVSLDRGERRALHADLVRQLGRLKVTVQPAEATLSVDGREIGSGDRELNLPIRPHNVRVTLPGHASFAQTITPKAGLIQEVRVKLLTLEEARLAALQPTIEAPDGQNLRLFKPFDFQMGASRREPGRRGNETLREVGMKRLFYLATHETTNAQFRRFAKGHDSGKYVESTLNEDDQPVANVSWHDAAAYCNWLSEKENLSPYYNIEFGKVTSINWNALGYRLPTEAEWSWAARTLGDEPGETQLRFPWGDSLPPPDRHGNYADRAASALVGRVIFGFNDNYPTSSPIGTYKATPRGLYDLGGNVAEWTNDFYEIPDAQRVVDPQGPKSGDYHVIKGSSWMHGSVTELRLSFRDYGIDGRADIGFRIARYAE